MRAGTSRWVNLVVVCSIVSACGQNPTADSQPADQKSGIAIEAVQLVNQDLSPGSFEEWKDDGNSKFPGFDVLTRLHNISSSAVQDADFIVLTTMEFVIAPTYLYQGDATKILSNGNWGRLVSVDDMKMETVPYLKPGDVVDLRIRNFNINKLFENYNGQDDTLWPWGLRVKVHVMNREMNRVAFGQAILRMIPGDNRLQAK